MTMLAAPLPESSRAAGPIPLVRPYFPPARDLQRLLEQVRASGQITNAGALHARLEQALADRFGWRAAALTCNGTAALHLALAGLDVSGEVVVPAFAFPATAQAVLLAGATPVAADVGPDGINLDPRAAAAAVGPRTSAILAVHTFGMPADVVELQAVADRHGLALVYDGAQAIDVRLDGRDLSQFGDACAYSLHATKVLHTVEGGCTVAARDVVARIRRLRNFGLGDAAGAEPAGTNAKLSEVHAAFGLLGLAMLDEHRRARREVYLQYARLLDGLSPVRLLAPPPGVEWNYGYAVLDVAGLDGVRAATLAGVLHNHGIDVRRYFDRRYVLSGSSTEATPRADRSRERLLCLPLWPGLARADVERICSCIWHACWPTRPPAPVRR